MSSLLEKRARVAGLSRSRSADDPDLLSARQSLAASRLEEYIRKTVDAAPPLSDEQRDRLALLLRGASDSSGAAPPGPTATSADGRTTQAVTIRCTTTAGSPEGRGAA